MDTRDLDYVIRAHSDFAKKPSSKTRMWDKKTPYYNHPIWCAATILHETSLPENIRLNGSQALLYHDVIEDTTSPLPPWITPEVRDFIEGMTFSSSEDEWANLWTRDSKVRLLKVYDKTSNMLDGVWMTSERREQHLTHLRRLVDDVKANYGELNILKIARTQF